MVDLPSEIKFQGLVPFQKRLYSNDLSHRMIPLGKKMFVC